MFNSIIACYIFGMSYTKQQTFHCTKSHYPSGNHHAKNVLFPGHNHLLTIGTDDLSLADAQAIIVVLGH